MADQRAEVDAATAKAINNFSAVFGTTNLRLGELNATLREIDAKLKLLSKQPAS